MNNFDHAFEGIVTSASSAADQRNIVYTILSDKIICATSPMLLDVGNIVAIKAINREGRPRIEEIEIIGSATQKEIEDALGRLLEKVDIKGNIAKALERHKSAEYSKGMHKISEAIGKAALAFASAYLSGAHIIVRFHNDCDGISGAISINRALAKLSDMLMIGKPYVSWVMQRGIEYDAESAYSDIMEFRNYASTTAPILLITDFGTAPGSGEQLRNTEKQYKIIMLDHHPPYNGFPREGIINYINSWDYGLDSSFTAGLLSSFFAETLADIDTRDMIKASLVGDFSEYADRSDELGQKLSIVLDYLTSIAGRRGSSIEKLTPSYADSLINNPEKFASTFYLASSSLNELLDLGVERAKKLNGDIADIFLLDFSELPKSESGYPLPGRYSSRLQEKLEAINGPRTILVLHYGSYITIRLPRAISGEAKLLEKINKILESSEYAESGGGHNEAASIKVVKDNSGEVLAMLLKELGCHT